MHRRQRTIWKKQATKIRTATVLLIKMGKIYNWRSLFRKAIKDREFIQICRINGESNVRILFRHIVPLLRNTIAVIFTTSVAQAVLMESSLSFLGMGIREPQASWGSMLSVTLDVMNIGSKWYIWLPAGLCIILMTYSVHLIGEGFRELPRR